MNNQVTEDNDIKKSEIQQGCAEKTIYEVNQFIKLITKNIVVILSSLTIVFIILIFVFQMGYLDVYGIPNKYINISLQSYIPTLYIFMGYISIILFNIVDWFARKNYNDSRLLDFKRMIISFLTAFIILSYTCGMTFILREWISIIIMFILEFLFMISEKKCTKLKKEVCKAKNGDNNSFLHERRKILEYIFYDCGVIIVVLLFPFIYMVGNNTAKTQTEYEILFYENSCYAIITDYKSYGIAQKAEIYENELLIETANYKLISKENITMENKKFEKVTIKGAK